MYFKIEQKRVPPKLMAFFQKSDLKNIMAEIFL